MVREERYSIRPVRSARRAGAWGRLRLRHAAVVLQGRVLAKMRIPIGSGGQARLQQLRRGGRDPARDARDPYGWVTRIECLIVRCSVVRLTQLSG